MLHWFEQRFSVKGLIVIVRHPCAVIASMLNWAPYWRGKTVDHEGLHQKYRDALPSNVYADIATLIDGFERWEEVLALQWALEYHMPFFAHAGTTYPWVLTSYERLVRHKEVELHRLASEIGLEVNDGMRAKLRRESKTASSGLTTKDMDKQLRKWKGDLDTGQVDAILGVVHSLGLTFYTEAAEPDHEHLGAFQRNGNLCW
jgi:hypothetical protein